MSSSRGVQSRDLGIGPLARVRAIMRAERGVYLRVGGPEEFLRPSSHSGCRHSGLPQPCSICSTYLRPSISRVNLITAAPREQFRALKGYPG